MKLKKIFDKQALTISEAAEYACVSRGTLTDWIKSGLLPYEELPGRREGYHSFRLIRKPDMDEFLNKHYRKKNTSHNKKISRELILYEIEA